MGEFWTAFGAFATAAGVFAVAFQVYSARKSADAISLLELAREQRILVRDLLDADEDSQEHRFNDLANFLEITSAAVNNKLFLTTTLEIATDLLCSFVVDIESERTWAAKLSNAVDAPNTFKHLQKFMASNRVDIDAVRKARAAKAK